MPPSPRLRVRPDRADRHRRDPRRLLRWRGRRSRASRAPCRSTPHRLGREPAPIRWAGTRREGRPGRGSTRASQACPPTSGIATSSWCVAITYGSRDSPRLGGGPSRNCRPRGRIVQVEKIREEDGGAREWPRDATTQSGRFRHPSTPPPSARRHFRPAAGRSWTRPRRTRCSPRPRQIERIGLLMRLTNGRRNGRREEYGHIGPELGAFIRKFNEDARNFNEDLPKKSPELKGNKLAFRPNWAALDAPSKANAIRAIEDRHFHAHEPPAVPPHELAHFEAVIPPLDPRANRRTSLPTPRLEAHDPPPTRGPCSAHQRPPTPLKPVANPLHSGSALARR